MASQPDQEVFRRYGEVINEIKVRKLQCPECGHQLTVDDNISKCLSDSLHEYHTENKRGALTDMTGMTGGVATGSNITGQARDVYNQVAEDIFNMKMDVVINNLAPQNNDDQNTLLETTRNTFVETKAADAVRKELEDRKFIVITGGPGDGKTSIALIASDDLLKTGRIQNVHILDDLEKLSTKHRKHDQMVILDNIFSAEKMCSVPKGKIPILHHFIYEEKVDYPPDLRVIMTVNRYDLEKFMSTHEHGKTYIKMSAVIDLSTTHKYTVEEQELMMQKYNVDEELHLQNLTGFPKLCAYFKNHPKNSWELNAHLHLRNELQKTMQSSRVRAALFIWMILCENKLLSDKVKIQEIAVQLRLQILRSLFPKADIDVLSQEAQLFIGIYFAKTADELLFIEPRVKEACISAIDAYRPGFLWKHFHIVLCHNESKEAETNDFKQTLHISQINADEIVSLLINFIKEGKFYLALTHPILEGNTAVDKLLEACDENMNTILQSTDIVGGTFLYWATHCKNKYLFKQIVKLPTTSSLVVNEAIMSAVLRKDFPNLRKIMETTRALQNYDLKYQDRRGYTFLMAASWLGVTEMVKFLIHFGACPKVDKMHCFKFKLSVTDKRNIGIIVCTCKSPLHLSSIEGHTDTVRELLLQSSLFSSDQIQSALLWACIRNKAGVVTALLESGVDVNVRDVTGCTPLMWACVADSGECLKCLTEAGADVNLQNKVDDTALIIACRRGLRNIATSLLSSAVFRVDVNLFNANEDTALQVACDEGHGSIVEILLKHDLLKVNSQANIPLLTDTPNPIINKTNGDGMSPLMIASRGGHTDIVSKLLSHNTEVDIIDKNGNTALMLAAQKGHIDIVNCLIKHKPNVLIRNREDMTACMIACNNGHLEIVRIIVTFNPEAANVQDGHVNTPLMWACIGGNNDIIDLLVDRGSRLNDTNNRGETVLMWAAYTGNEHALKRLLQKVDVNVLSENGESAISIICQQNASLLSSVSEEIFSHHLKWALSLGHWKIVLSILQIKKRDLYNIFCKPHEKFVIQVAIEEKNLQVIKLLRTKECDISTVDINGFNILHYACMVNSVDIVQFILSQNIVDIDKRDLSVVDSGLNTIFHHACKVGNIDIVRGIISKTKTIINKTNKQGKTPLMLAEDGGHLGVVELLIQAGELTTQLKGHPPSTTDPLMSQTEYQSSATTEGDAMSRDDEVTSDFFIIEMSDVTDSVNPSLQDQKKLSVISYWRAEIKPTYLQMQKWFSLEKEIERDYRITISKKKEHLYLCGHMEDIVKADAYLSAAYGQIQGSDSGIPARKRKGNSKTVLIELSAILEETELKISMWVASSSTDNDILFELSKDLFYILHTRGEM